MANQIRECFRSYDFDCNHPSTDFSSFFYFQKRSVDSAWMTIFKVLVHRVSESFLPVFFCLSCLLVFSKLIEET